MRCIHYNKIIKQHEKQFYACSIGLIEIISDEIGA
jgi:hypothetical protein